MHEIRVTAWVKNQTLKQPRHLAEKEHIKKRPLVGRLFDILYKVV